MNASRQWLEPRLSFATSVGSSGFQTAVWQQPVRDRTPASLTERGAVQQDWQTVVIQRLKNLLLLEDNWDSYGGISPSPGAAMAMFDVLREIQRLGAKPPAIVPSSMGHFQAEWHTQVGHLEVEVLTPTRIVASYANRQTGEEWDDREFNFDLRDLAGAAQAIVSAA